MVVHKPKKYAEGNTLIHDPSGRIHFVNLSTSEYYWTARRTYQEVAYTFVKDDDFDDYFGFKEEDNDLFYFTKSGHKKINCDQLEEIVADINKDRTDGVEFKVSTRESTFWIDFFDGTVYMHEKEVENEKFDTIEIQRRDYHIWHDNYPNKKMDLKFARLIKCVGPCLCKVAHVEDDYAESNVKYHEDRRNGNLSVLHFRDYVKLLDFEKKLSLPRLPKVNLIVYFDKPVRDGVYYGLYDDGFLPVIVKEIKQMGLATQYKVKDNLFKLNVNKRFLQFFGIYEFQNRSFLVFESFSHDMNKNTKEELFEEALSKEELFKNLRGLIKAVAWMQTYLPLNLCGNINTSTVVLVKNDKGQGQLKLFIEGFSYESKDREDDMRGLGEVLAHCIALSESANPESDHLIECLKDGRCNINDLINHPTFSTQDSVGKPGSRF